METATMLENAGEVVLADIVQRRDKIREHAAMGKAKRPNHKRATQQNMPVSDAETGAIEIAPVDVISEDCLKAAKKFDVDKAILHALHTADEESKTAQATAQTYSKTATERLDSAFETVKSMSIAELHNYSGALKVLAHKALANGKVKKERIRGVAKTMQYCRDCRMEASKTENISTPDMFEKRKEFEQYWEEYLTPGAILTLKAIFAKLIEEYKTETGRAKAAQCIARIEGVYQEYAE